LCLAEQTYGAARGVEDFAMMDITGGLGLGVVQGGQFIQGHSGLAGELGHVTVDLAGRRCGCGNVGCLETVATDAALATLVSERLGRSLSADDLFPLLESGEIRAPQEISLVLEYLSVGLAMVINVFNPQKLFVYGRLFDAGDDVYPRLLDLTRRRALAPSLADCEIIRAQGNKRLGAIAGYCKEPRQDKSCPTTTPFCATCKSASCRCSVRHTPSGRRRKGRNRGPCREA
jgi:N-acetylglucosamine repressor